ncbi:MAG TPA: hypothetical protein VFD87_18540, partial [Phototrophicaceae bacterium]|nr:hypothetical protein [Phototrophicaceae bacterium]
CRLPRTENSRLYKALQSKNSLGQLQKEKALGYGVRITGFPNAYHPITGHAGSSLGRGELYT